jgi:hypothetical protein
MRVALLLLFFGAMGAAAYLFWIAEQQARAAEALARTFDSAAQEARTQTADLRSQQQAYVAPGQGPEFWFTRVSATLVDLDSRITALKSRASHPQSAAKLDETTGLLQDFEQIDTRTREYLRSRQNMLAANLIYSDGFAVAARISESIEQVRIGERASRDAAIAALQRREVFSLGAAATAAALIVLLLVPSGQSEPEPTRVSIAPPVMAAPAATGTVGLSLDRGSEADGWTPAKKRTEAIEPKIEPKKVATTTPQAPAAPVAAPAAAVPAPAPIAAKPAPPVRVEPEPPAVDLPAVSRLCNDLARVIDTRALPGLLERAATVLDASGVILWVADPDGRELAPIMTHGYASNLVNRLGTIPRDARNATADAFRTSLVQVVKADNVSPGAIAAPLVTGGGCVGVMAAEVRHDRETKDAVLAAAGIIAAQLATLVGPPASSRAKTEAAG